MPIRGMEDKRELDQERLKELAFLDDLTSLYNRRYLYRYLPTELREVHKFKRNLCLFMMDVDNFKEINDTYGHLCGDKVLVEIADILRESFREGDTIIRYAGDEFIALLPGAEEEVAVKIAKRIIDKVNKHPFKEQQNKANVHVTISIGLALFPRDAQDPERLIYQADRALYFSKRSGRNRICTTPQVSREILDEKRIEELFPCPQLVGRSQQLRKLNQLLEKTSKGQSRLVLIKGDRGIGKSRLLEEFKKSLQRQDLISVHVCCSADISTQPYQILISVLENLFSSLGSQVREFIRSLPEAQMAQLANYIPLLKQFLPEDFKEAKKSSQQQDQLDLFKAICQSLIYAVKSNTLFLTIDDFHWIDEATLQLFNYIVKDLSNARILIAAAYRDEELQRRSHDFAVKEIVQQIKQNELVDEINLLPLEKKDVLIIIKAIFPGIKISTQFLDIVYDVSAGNPLFTEEVLRNLASKQFIVYQDKLWQSKEIKQADFSPYLKEAIQRRVAQLDEETKPVVSAAAVIGEVFDFDILCQLLEKDSGYVLEVMDRTTKLRLIKPESPFQTDRFKFVSGFIRDVIYDGLDIQEKQRLHKKLALLEERANRNNIDLVMGSLGYHFGKAQDKIKSALYSNMLLEKARMMPSKEDVFGFMQEAFLEKAEEIVVPLTNEGMKLVPAMIRSARLAIQNVRLYPAHSAIREGFVEQAYRNLTGVLNKDSNLMISTTENRMLINGEEISLKAAKEAGADTFVRIMVDYRIKSINFKRNLTKTQLTVFLEALSQNYDDLIEQGGLSGYLRKNAVSHLKVNEVRYAQTTKLNQQRAKFEDAMLVDYLLGRTPNLEGSKGGVAIQLVDQPEQLAQTLKKIAQTATVKEGEDKTQVQAELIAKSLQRLSEQFLTQAPQDAMRYRKNIGQAIMALEPRLRSKLIQSQSKTDSPILNDIIQESIQELSDQDIFDLVDTELSESKEDLTSLRNLIHRLLFDPQRRKQLLPGLRQRLRQAGLNEEEASWVLGEDLWGGLSLDEKVKQFLRLSGDDYRKLEISKQIDNLVAQLLKNNQESRISEIVDKLIKQLQDRSKQLRSATINDLGKISKILIARKKYFLLEQIVNGLNTRLSQEKDPQVYSQVALVVANVCASLIKEQNFTQATGILKEFNRHLDKDSKLSEIQKQALKEARDRIITAHSLVDWLIRLLETKVDNHRDFYELSQLIKEMGSRIIAPLCSLGISNSTYSDPFKSYALRWSIAKVLKDMGDSAVLHLKDRLNEKNKEEIKTTLELLGHMQNKGAVKYLQPLLKNQDFNLRQEAISTLGKIGGSEAVKLLSESIKDKNKRIRSATIWALANIGSPDVLPILKPLLKEENLAGEVKRIVQRIERNK